MTNDYRGQALSVGSVYVPLAKLRHDAAAGQVVDLGGKARPLQVKGGQLYPVAKLVDTEDPRLPLSQAMRDWMNIQTARWWDAAYAGIGSSGSGTGTNYQASPEYHPIARDDGTIACHMLDTGSGTSGVNCRTVYTSAPCLYLGTGRLYWQRIAINNLAQIQTFRFGFWGGGASTPGATGGRPGKGLWLEFDRAISTSKLWLACADGGSVTTADTGLAAANNLVGDWCFGVTGGKGFAWEVRTQESALCNVATNLPSTANAQAGRLFFQIEKTNPASSSGGYLFNMGQAPLWTPTLLLPSFPV